MYSGRILVFCCVPSVQRTNPTRQTRLHFATLFNFEILLLKELTRPNRSVRKSRSSYELQSHICPCSHLGEKSCCELCDFWCRYATSVAVVFVVVYRSSQHMFATSFLSAHMLFLFHLSNSPRTDYDVKFAFCRKTIGLDRLLRSRFDII